MKYQAPQPQSYSAETAALITQLKDRIKRLEKACGEMVSEEDTYIRLQTWRKAKEAKP